jgi:alpha-amylase
VKDNGMKIFRVAFLLIFLLVILVACDLTSPEVIPSSTPEETPAETAAPTETAPNPPSETPQPTPEPSATSTGFPPVTVVPSPVSVGEPWWNDRVFYEIFVRSFNDSDGDGIGDLQGLIDKLDYLNDGDPTTTDDLGITGIWLMPITTSPSYHGYDVTDYLTVDPDYGTNEDFTRLVEEAHKRGIYVIVDLVMNHTSNQHPWFISSKDEDPEYRDWYIWMAEHPAYLGPWNQKVWNLTSNGFYYSVFWSGMPDLNLRNPEVTAELYEIIRFWLEDLKTDGFRLDAIKHLIENGRLQENTPQTHAWLQEFHNFYKGVNSEAVTVGEAWTSTTEVLDYTGDEVDIAFAFDLAGAFMNTAKGPVIFPVVNELSKVVESYPPGQYATFLTNHDQDRLMSQLRDVPKAKLAALMLLTSSGVPFLYYGEEIGMTGTKPDEDIRRPMQWNADLPGVGFTTGSPWRDPASDAVDVNVAIQTDDPASLLTHYRTLIQLRNQYAALRTGEWTLVDSESSQIYAYLRHDQDENILVLMNVGSDDVTAGDYGLTLESETLTGPVKANSLWGLENPYSPEINAEGGFTNYTPFEVIPGQSFAIIQFVP